MDNVNVPTLAQLFQHRLACRSRRIDIVRKIPAANRIFTTGYSRGYRPRRCLPDEVLRSGKVRHGRRSNRPPCGMMLSVGPDSPE